MNITILDIVVGACLIPWLLLGIASLISYTSFIRKCEAGRQESEDGTIQRR